MVSVVASQRNGEMGGAVERVGEGDGVYSVRVEAGSDRAGIHGGRLHSLALDGEHLAAKLESKAAHGAGSWHMQVTTRDHMHTLATS